MQLTFYTVQPTDALVSNLMGVDVYNAQNESIGEIEDAIVDDGKILRALVIGVGGFLGPGERYVAVDPKSVLLTRGADGALTAYVNTTRETLRDAPEFKYEGSFRRRTATQTGAATGGNRDIQVRAGSPPAANRQRQ